MAAEINKTVQEFNVKQKSSGGERVVARVDERHANVVIECDGVEVHMNYPRDKDSVYYCTKPEWLSQDLNGEILGGKLKTLLQILGSIASRVARHNEASGSGGESGSDLGNSNNSDLSQSAGGLAVSGFYDDDEGGRHFALNPQQFADLKRHVDEAKEMLGEERVQLVEELGSVKMTLNMFEFMDATLAEKLGYNPEEPVFVSFCYEKSPVPTVSCTQRLNPDYGVKNHLKSILDHFFHYWNTDRAVLKKVGRPPKELSEQMAGGAAPAPDVINNNNNAPAAAAVYTPPPTSTEATTEVKKKSWWQGLLGKKDEAKPPPPPAAAAAATTKASGANMPSPSSAATSPIMMQVVSEDKLSTVMDLGFDAVAAMRALLEANTDPDKATMLLLGTPDKYAATEAQLASFNTLCGMGFGSALSAAALIKHKFELDAAATACCKPMEVWTTKKEPAAVPAKDGKKSTAKKAKKEEPVQEQPPPEVPQDNFIFALLTYLQERLGHYSSYCVSCQSPHSCWNPDGGVVCCEPLCVFQLEGSPMEKLISVRQCPFQDCEKLDLSTAGKDFMGLPLQQVCKDYNITSQQLLEMILHKYLPPEEMKKFLNDGLKLVQAKKVESVLNPALCARFEHAWKKMRETRKDMKVSPHVAYHGTSEANLGGITSTGFLLNKLSSGSGDNGWYGCGIYCSQNVQTAMGYCRGRKMLVCAVLMGKIYKCPGRMDGAKLQSGYDSHEDPSGYEWVIFNEEHILPCYIVHL